MGVPELRVLEMMSPENNRYVRARKEVGIIPKKEFDTQALLELQLSYCEKRKCLFCRIGHHLMKQKNVRQKT